MDSPTIAIHVIIPNEVGIVHKTNIDNNQNRLYFSLSQPVGSHNCGLTLSASTSSKAPTKGIGMIDSIDPKISPRCNSNNIAQVARSSAKLDEDHNNNDPTKMACETPMKRLKKVAGIMVQLVQSSVQNCSNLKRMDPS
jgi:hypothetical protein